MFNQDHPHSQTASSGLKTDNVLVEKVGDDPKPLEAVRGPRLPIRKTPAHQVKCLPAGGCVFIGQRNLSLLKNLHGTRPEKTGK